MIYGIGLTGTDSSMAAPGFVLSWLQDNGIDSRIQAVSGRMLPGYFRGFEMPDRRRSLFRRRQVRQWARDFYNGKPDDLRYAFLFDEPDSGRSVAVTNGFSLSSEGMAAVSDENRREMVQTAAGVFACKGVFSICGKPLTPCYSQSALDCALNLMGADRMLTFVLKAGGKPEVQIARRDIRHRTVLLQTTGWRPGRENVQEQLQTLLTSIRQDCYDFLFF